MGTAYIDLTCKSMVLWIVMKILNLYAGIGGNRKLWGDEHEITAVEYKPEIAAIYQDFFPNDKVIVADAHQYLLDHFDEFDFIWSSPPCPTHSSAAFAGAFKAGKTGFNYRLKYPDMALYQEIIILQTAFNGKWCVENVEPYYTPLIPATRMEEHLWWTNFHIREFNSGNKGRDHHSGIEKLQERKGFDLTSYKGIDKIKTLRNCVEPEMGKHILDCAINDSQTQLL